MSSQSPGGHDWDAEFETATRRAFEVYVLELVRRLAPLQESAERDIRQMEEVRFVLRAELSGEYPETSVDVHTFDRVRKRVVVIKTYIWDDDYRTADGMRSATYIAADVLIRSRGG